MPTSYAQAALDGVRILDLSLTLPGPYASFLLGQLGAEVTRIVPPWGDSAEEFLPTLSLVQQGKRALTLDLKDPGAQRALYAQAATADVVLEGFRPGVAARLGADADTLQQANPHLVYCSLSGYGQDNAMRTMPGHDINYQSLAGVFNLTTAERPEIGAYPRVPLADLAMAAHAVIAVLAGLRARDTTGNGCYIDLAAADSLLSFVGPYVQALGNGRKLTEELPHYGAFQGADGQWLTIGIVYEQHFWVSLVEALDLPADWAKLRIDDRQRRTAEIRAAIQDRISTQNAATWAITLSRANVPAMALRTPEAALRDEHFVDRGVVQGNAETSFIGLPFHVQPLTRQSSTARPGP